MHRRVLQGGPGMAPTHVPSVGTLHPGSWTLAHQTVALAPMALPALRSGTAPACPGGAPRRGPPSPPTTAGAAACGRDTPWLPERLPLQAGLTRWCHGARRFAG